MNKTLERILRIAMDDFKSITENEASPFIKGGILRDYLDNNIPNLDIIINESKDAELVSQCIEYKKAYDSRRPNKWDKIKEKEEAWDKRIEQSPETLEEAIDMVYEAGIKALNEHVNPTPVPPQLSNLVDLYLIPHLRNQNQKYDAFLKLPDIYGNKFECTHITVVETPTICEKDGMCICSICGKTVPMKDIEAYVERTHRPSQSEVMLSVSKLQEILGGNNND